MSVIGTLKKIFSNYNGQTPSTGKEIEDAFNDNFEDVKTAVNKLSDDTLKSEIYRQNTPPLIQDSRFDRIVDIWSASSNLIGEAFKFVTCNKGGNVAIKHETLGVFLAASTKTSGLEYVKLKNGANTHYVILVVNWDIDAANVNDPDGSTDSVVAGIPRTHYLLNVHSLIANNRYLVNGNIVYNSDEILQSCNIIFSNGASGTLTKSVYDNNVLEYKTTTITYTDQIIGTLIITQSREFSDLGNIISETLINITY
ncbi:MAG: hypothetical protein VB046_08415 [Paludibacter sp.]|nr:hypothetical protein [Paludibacter sp.]